jgi:hypothetical protein
MHGNNGIQRYRKWQNWKSRILYVLTLKAMGVDVVTKTKLALTLWSRSSSKLYLKIQFVPQRKHLTIAKINWLTLFKEIIAVYYENHTKPKNTLCGQNVELHIVKVGCTYNYHWRVLRVSILFDWRLLLAVYVDDAGKMYCTIIISLNFVYKIG